MEYQREILAGCGAILVSVSAAAADVVYMSQNRSVDAYAVGVSQSFSAPDFGPFHAIANANSSLEGARAVQDSTLGSTGITASGDASASGTMVYDDHASSSLNVTFMVTGDTTFLLSGQLEAWSQENATLRLWRGNTLLTSLAALSAGPPTSFSVPGSFVTGQSYRLEAQCSGRRVPGANTWGWFNFTLAVPAPGATSAFAGLGILVVGRRRR